MNEYFPIFLYVIPIFLAASVLIRVRIRKLHPEPEVESGPVVTPDDPLVEEVRSSPIQKRFISYTT
ncbi:MAG: hypothetical protein ACR2O1_15135 [Boseongicola sp.]